MDNVKPWQIILIVLALGALVFTVMKFGFKPSVESQMANSMTLVDVETGQLYVANLGGKNTIIVPMRHPDSDEVALLPVFEEDGEWFLWERYRDAMGQITVTPNAVPNIDGPVNVLEDSPIKLKQ
ncbi:MAG: hypothetical protein P1U42_02645 [Phycisphaerales bacterium]|nr:hypothetical protein [Phycisphaerales bacterium]